MLACANTSRQREPKAHSFLNGNLDLECNEEPAPRVIRARQARLASLGTEDDLRPNVNASKEDMTMTTIRTLAFAGLTVLASVGAAAAYPAAPISANQFYALYQAQGPVVSAKDMGRYDHSGSRGRLNLGANAIHPEGPGNFSD